MKQNSFYAVRESFFTPMRDPDEISSIYGVITRNKNNITSYVAYAYECDCFPDGAAHSNDIVIYIRIGGTQ